MTDVIIFGGTTEGRLLAETLSSRGLSVYVCTATGYGGSLIRKDNNIKISDERLDAAGMAGLIKKEKVKVVADATHPYATAVSANIKKACADTGTEYIRLLRPEGLRNAGNVTVVKDTAAAAEYLKGTEGNVLVATGSKELERFTSVSGYKERIFARVLPLPDVMEHCVKLGFQGRNLICMQGPFNEDVNYGTMVQFQIRYMVTKDSGGPGGFGEKMRAAERAGVHVILVGRPPETGRSYDPVLKELSERFGLRTEGTTEEKKRNVWVIGGGMDGRKGITAEAAEACRNADLIIGPKRMTAAAGAGKNVLNEYRPEKIIPYIREHPEFGNIAVIFSGDIGFYSGAKKFIGNADPEWNVIPVCGISSVVYLCSKLAIPWQDIRSLNGHAAEPNTIGEIRRNEKVFSLLTKGTDVNKLCDKMIRYNMNDVIITVGERLGYPDERITQGRPHEMADKEFADLSVILVTNNYPDKEFSIGIQDTEFIRSDVPMTKSEVRTLTAVKLKLKDDSVVYDIGAGTGSVAVEMSRIAVNGKIYAIERDDAALQLMEENKNKFASDNIEIVRGTAPAALKGLPAPTHAFIGGSGGNLRKILGTLIKKNRDVRIAINSVTLETVGETIRCIKELGLNETETVCVSVSRSRTTENVHLMTAQNPVYITICEGVK